MNNMIKFFLPLLLLISSISLLGQEKYVYTIDLKNVQDDRVKISLEVPTIKEKTAIFTMPSVIPGSYAKKDYGRFIVDFKAFDKQGQVLKTKRKGDNLIVIKNAKQLFKVEYWVDDTWDHDDYKKFVFQPGGSNIEDGKNFSINNHAFFGYFEGYKMVPFELRFNKPADMFGATNLKRQVKDAENEVFFAPNYVYLVDNPMMYCVPDTTSFMVRNTQTYVSVYSPNKVVSATKIAGYLKPLGKALGNFFGTLPVDQYHFLFYFADPNVALPDVEGLSGFGALEHSYSSFYYLPEMDFEMALKGMIQDVSGHEFLHILTPLNIHSEQIEDFNFVKPDMSKHLWMYEGVTEYFANLVQVCDSIITEEEFQGKMREKIIRAAEFKKVSFTKMSDKIIKNKYQEHYLDVYQKGALIGLALDLLLIDLSDGKYGIRELMLDLAKKYGPNKPFKDDDLIDEIVAMTYPEVRDFFNNYVVGKERIPYNVFFDIIGWQYQEEMKSEGYGFGSFALGFNPDTKALLFVDVAPDNAFGLKDGDVLETVNGVAINTGNIRELLSKNLLDKRDMEPVSLGINRAGESKEFTATPKPVITTERHVIKSMEQASEQQLRYRKFLLQRQ